MHVIDGSKNDRMRLDVNEVLKYARIPEAEESLIHTMAFLKRVFEDRVNEDKVSDLVYQMEDNIIDFNLVKLVTALQADPYLKDFLLFLIKTPEYKEIVLGDYVQFEKALITLAS